MWVLRVRSTPILNKYLQISLHRKVTGSSTVLPSTSETPRHSKDKELRSVREYHPCDPIIQNSLQKHQRGSMSGRILNDALKFFSLSLPPSLLVSLSLVSHLNKILYTNLFWKIVISVSDCTTNNFAQTFFIKLSIYYLDFFFVTNSDPSYLCITSPCIYTQTTESVFLYTYESNTTLINELVYGVGGSFSKKGSRENDTS